jgi:hypothetical protein
MLSKNDFANPTRKIDSNQTPMCNVDSKNPVAPIRLLRIRILQFVRGDFFYNIDPQET